jgi:hypothetical protein
MADRKSRPARQPKVVKTAIRTKFDNISIIRHVIEAMVRFQKPLVYEISMKKPVISIIHGANPTVYGKSGRYVQVV